ncbi:MAG: flagellar biosynthetic protein FliO [Acidobacteriota bacterium]|nr:flagellar biosynthetic protein FliO [Acidobacteriota bacterium]
MTLLLAATVTTPDAGWAGVGSQTPVIGVGNLVSVVLVLAALAALAWLLRRGKLKLPGKRREQAVTVETAVSLGEHRSLVIVAVEGRRLLLGMAPGQVTLLTELRQAAPAFGVALERQLSPTGEGEVA